jgi:NAD(P)-dependent dehydrogenase (short-subunit alcohol dehydrogenase family)
LEDYQAGYDANGKGFFLFAQKVLPLLLESVEGSEHPPTLVITGATASLRGGANMSSFASGKFALRATGQSLAREFGPKGVHVVHAIIDGVIDIPRTKEWMVGAGPDAKINSDAVSGYLCEIGVVLMRRRRLQIVIGISILSRDRISLKSLVSITLSLTRIHTY